MFGERVSDPHSRTEELCRQRWASNPHHLHPTEATALMSMMLEFHVIFCLTKGVLTVKKKNLKITNFCEMLGCNSSIAPCIVKVLDFIMSAVT